LSINKIIVLGNPTFLNTGKPFLGKEKNYAPI
jgi:hypothetical protein